VESGVEQLFSCPLIHACAFALDVHRFLFLVLARDRADGWLKGCDIGSQMLNRNIFSER
jgi:hypothetical protein